MIVNAQPEMWCYILVAEEGEVQDICLIVRNLIASAWMRVATNCNICVTSKYNNDRKEKRAALHWQSWGKLGGDIETPMEDNPGVTGSMVMAGGFKEAAKDPGTGWAISRVRPAVWIAFWLVQTPTLRDKMWYVWWMCLELRWMTGGRLLLQHDLACPALRVFEHADKESGKGLILFLA